ncbi:unnamed protein product [Arctia plantaginis]|uniref:Cilia- and flagella-associated protein 43 n=1 Tax=Arctia plantaginis TaxID=874455 RepID=A0A8S0ZVQ0_ARCPL|nr:unnamed protein product [Arctia plantaginis]
MTETVEDIPEQPKYKPKAGWTIPHRLDLMTFIGKEVFVVANDVYIIFLNLKTAQEIVYTADSAEKGDGVDAVCDKEVNRYKGLCMMEGELIAGFTGFPNYICTIWSWRTNQRLVRVSTGVIRRKQIYMASRMHMTVCQCWGEGLIVWEVGQCYKKCFLLRRAKEEVTGWEISEPTLVDVCWCNDGTLYAIDSLANLYYIVSDGITMVANLEFEMISYGKNRPHMCAFGNGLLVYGPDKNIRSLKKDDEHKSWKVVWMYEVQDVVERLVSNCTCDTAVVWTRLGFVYKITGDSEEKIDIHLFTFKMRYITKIQLLAPDYKYLAAMNEFGTLAIYDVYTTELLLMRHVIGNDISFVVSPTEILILIFGEVGGNYGMALYTYKPTDTLEQVARMCLTHQIVSRVTFSATGREIVAGAMSAGHIFIIKLSEDYKLTLVRYTEIGRGLADLFLMKVGDAVRCFSLVLFSDKYAIGERVVCINAETGKENKFAGKMQGPYAQFMPCETKDTLIAVPHLSRQLHVLKLSGDKGVTVAVKMGPIIDTGHQMKHYETFNNKSAFLTFGYEGHVILRKPHVPEEYDLKLIVTHRYGSGGRGGIKQALIDDSNKFIISLSGNSTLSCIYLNSDEFEQENVKHKAPDTSILEEQEQDKLKIINEYDKNYLDLQEEKKVYEETMDFKRQRDEVCKTFAMLQSKLVELLEENIAEIPLHQLSLSEFNLHHEAKRERIKQAEKEREMIRLETEALMKAQDKVTAWIKKSCWDCMQSQRVKLFAVFSHYHVENFAILPTQRDRWPELTQVEALRTVQMEGEEEFRPWEEPEIIVEALTEENLLNAQSELGQQSSHRNVVDDEEEGVGRELSDAETDAPVEESYALSGSAAHHFIKILPFAIPQTLAYSFLHMNWLQQITKLTTQHLRQWFNKQFDDLMALKVKEVGLVKERNARLRFIVEELNKLSDLRGSFHHLIVEIKDPEWRQEEHTHKLIKVEPEECSIEPYISPSQIVIIPPDPGPKDDFKERALMDMMDGVLEKLWHEEIKKPIPVPQCMLEKAPEHFNEEDLRFVFDYEAKVAFRNEERDKYRKMLHAEYAKLSATLNEGIVKFNQKVKETWLLRLRIDSVIGQENLNLLRLRRVNLDRIEMSEKIEKYREEIASLEEALEVLNREFQQIQEQANECQNTYDQLTLKDRSMERTFKNHFNDLSPVIVDQCYKFFKKRPKWHQRASLTPTVLYELAQAVATGVCVRALHADCVDFFKSLEQMDNIVNMPPVMDDQLWATMCKLRRAKAENEIRMRAVAQEMAYVEHVAQVWSRAIHARRVALNVSHNKVTEHRLEEELTARNKTIQLVLPAGQVEIVTTGHIEDFEDATLILRDDIEKINQVILKVGDIKLRMMRKQMDFRKGILSKEWEHARMKLKLRHMEQELNTYKNLKIPKELQRYLKDKERGFTDEMDYIRLERELESNKNSVNKKLQDLIRKVEDAEVYLINIDEQVKKVDNLILKLNLNVSEKRLNEDPLEPIRIRRIFKTRMETLIARSQLIREVQANHSTIVMLQTELELLRLKTYPTLASFRELD